MVSGAATPDELPTCIAPCTKAPTDAPVAVILPPAVRLAVAAKVVVPSATVATVALAPFLITTSVLLPSPLRTKPSEAVVVTEDDANPARSLALVISYSASSSGIATHAGLSDQVVPSNKYLPPT